MNREVSLLRDYIAIPSVNPMGRSELPADVTGEARYARRVAEDFKRLGLDHHFLGQGERLSVYAEARTPNAADTVLIASHLDTVPVDTMTIDPFNPEVKDGRVFGRGATDTKGGLAAAIAALERVLSRGKLKRNVILAGQADEELSSIGALDLIAELSHRRPLWGLATEPTKLRLVTHHKGVARAVVRSTGVACHSSDPSQGENAIVRLCHGVLALERHAAQLATRRDELLGSPSLSVGIIAGGQAQNIVPDAAELVVDRRLLPGETSETVHAELLAALNPPGFRALSLDCHIEKPALGIPATSRAALACKAALSQLGLIDSPAAAWFGTDAGLFTDAGIPCVVLGPGSIEQAHTGDEYLALADLEAATRFFEALFGG